MIPFWNEPNLNPCFRSIASNTRSETGDHTGSIHTWNDEGACSNSAQARRESH